MSGVVNYLIQFSYETANSPIFVRNVRNLGTTVVSAVTGAIFLAIGIPSLTISILTGRLIKPLNKFSDDVIPASVEAIALCLVSTVRTFNSNALPSGEPVYRNKKAIACNTILPKAIHTCLKALYHVEWFNHKNKMEFIQNRIQYLEGNIKKHGANLNRLENHAAELDALKHSTLCRRLLNRVAANIGSILLRIVTIVLAVVTFPIGLIAGIFACAPFFGHWKGLNEFAATWITVPFWAVVHATSDAKQIISLKEGSLNLSIV